MAATIHLRSSLVHADVFIRICDVHPGRRSLNVSDGILRLDDQNVPATTMKAADREIFHDPVHLSAVVLPIADTKTT